MIPKGYKFSEEVRRNMGLSHVGSKRSEETKKKMRTAQGFNKESNPLWRCLDCGLLKIKYGVGRCKRCYTKYSIGENASQWKGGITPINKQIRSCFKYRQWRSDVFTRDEYICQWCLQKGGILNADHIKPFAQIVLEYGLSSQQDANDCEELWNINNGRTLCIECHKKTESYQKPLP